MENVAQTTVPAKYGGDLFDDAAYRVICSSEERRRWLDERMKGIGASEAATVLGLNPWRTPLSLFAEKIGVEPPADENEAMYWGSKIEPLIIDRFEQETGRKVLRTIPAGHLLQSKERPWQLATLDAAQGLADDKDGPGVLEIKVTGLRERWDDGLPDYVNAQVQHQLDVTGWSWGSVGVLFGGRDFRWLDFERDEAFIADMRRAESEFWRAVVEGEPPDAGAGDKATIAALWPHDDGSTITLGGEFVNHDEELDRIKTELKQLEQEKAYHENAIKAAMREATTAVLPSGVIYSLKEQHRKEVVMKATSFRVLRRKAVK